MPANEKFAYHLPTPCGSITVRDDRNNLLPFAARASGFETAFIADSGTVFNTPHKFVIALSASRLEQGRAYRIALEGIPLAVGAADECNECVAGSGAGHSIAIGGADPNEPEKYSQYLAHRSADEPPYSITAEYDFDRSSFVRYDLHILPDCSGFRFERLDEQCDEIVFFAAWIETRPGIENETEDAVQFWVL